MKLSYFCFFFCIHLKKKRKKKHTNNSFTVFWKIEGIKSVFFTRQKNHPNSPNPSILAHFRRNLLRQSLPRLPCDRATGTPCTSSRLTFKHSSFDIFFPHSVFSSRFSIRFTEMSSSLLRSIRFEDTVSTKKDGHYATIWHLVSSLIVESMNTAHHFRIVAIMVIERESNVKDVRIPVTFLFSSPLFGFIIIFGINA